MIEVLNFSCRSIDLKKLIIKGPRPLRLTLEDLLYTSRVEEHEDTLFTSLLEKLNLDCAP